MHHDGVDAVLEALHRGRAGRGERRGCGAPRAAGRPTSGLALGRRRRRAAPLGGSACAEPRARAAASRPAWPSACTATVSTTGQPSSAREPVDVDRAGPRARATSAMLSATISGRPSCFSSSTRRRFMRRLVASTTATIASGAASPCAPALDHLERDLLVGRGRRQAVGAGQVDDRDRAAVRQARQADLALDRDAGVVGDLLARAGEQVEERGLAAVRVADQRDAPERRVVRRRSGRATMAWRLTQPPSGVTSMHCASSRRRANIVSPISTASGSRPPGPRRSSCTGSPGRKPSSPSRRRATASTSGEAATTRATVARAPAASEASVSVAAGGREGVRAAWRRQDGMQIGTIINHNPFQHPRPAVARRFAVMSLHNARRPAPAAACTPSGVQSCRARAG